MAVRICAIDILYVVSPAESDVIGTTLVAVIAAAAIATSALIFDVAMAYLLRFVLDADVDGHRPSGAARARERDLFARGVDVDLRVGRTERCHR
jgi:hypothetical protein